MNRILPNLLGTAARLWQTMRQRRDARAVEKKWGRVTRELDAACEKMTRLEAEHRACDDSGPRQGAKQFMSATSWLAALGLTLVQAVHAVRPLTIDDADTVDYGRLQLSLAGNYLHEPQARLFTVPFGAAYGVSSNCEASVLLGGQWVEHFRDGAKRQDEGALDTGFSLKYRWLNQTNHGFVFSTRADVKFPTASEQRGLGTGNYDAGLVLIATKTWQDFGFDCNLGYTFVNPAGQFGDGDFLAGQTVRYAITETFSLVGEVLARVPVGTGSRTVAEVHGGYQWEIVKDLVLDGLVGTGLNSSSPYFIATLGVMWTF